MKRLAILSVAVFVAVSFAMTAFAFAEKKTIVIAFMDKKVLKEFRQSSGWKIGVDASIAVIALGADGSIDSATLDKPIVAFVFDQKGLMYNLTLEGAKITKLVR